MAEQLGPVDPDEEVSPYPLSGDEDAAALLGIEEEEELVEGDFAEDTDLS